MDRIENLPDTRYQNRRKINIGFSNIKFRQKNVKWKKSYPGQGLNFVNSQNVRERKLKGQ